MIDIWHGLLLTAVGLIAGFLNVLAGGGSLLTMPAMVFMGMDGPEANGTNRIAILAQNFSAVLGFAKNGYSDARMSLIFTLAALPGTVIGAIFGTKLSGVWFNRVLAGVMIGVMILMAQKKKPAATSTQLAPVALPKTILAYVFIFAAGFYSGFIQAGVGFILMAILNRSFGLDLVRVNMHKVFIIGVSTLAALLIFANQGHVNWLAGIYLAVGNAGGGWLGAHLSIKKGEKLIRIVLNLVLIAMAIKLIISR